MYYNKTLSLLLQLTDFLFLLKKIRSARGIYAPNLPRKYATVHTFMLRKT